jgi:transposase
LDGVVEPIDNIERLKEQLATSTMLNGKLLTHVEELTQRNEELIQRVEELTRQVNKNSSNSNKPPSSDGLSERQSIRKQKRPTGRKRGGQPGHQGHYRGMVPPDQVDAVVDVFPEMCDVCLSVPPRTLEAEPFRHQVVDLLDNGARHITEYRCHCVKCTCGEHLSAPIDKIPSSAFGPRLASAVCMLTGDENVSRRRVPVVLKELFGIEMSLGSVSNIEARMTKALALASDEAMAHVESAAVKHVDETSWLREARRCSAWVLACVTVTVLRIVADGRRGTLRKLLRRRRGVLVSDRAAVFLFWSMGRRQICWSHLSRKFIGFSQRAGPAGVLGRDLATCSELVFGYWRQYQSGLLSHARVKQLIEAVQRAMLSTLRRAVALDTPEVSGSCANMIEHWDGMWNFVDTPGVEPTNNHAERELRRLVMWRRRSFGSQSERGDRFVERILTVTHTLRKQRRQVLGFLQASFQAMLSATSAPQLLASV